MKLANFTWIREPRQYTIEENTLNIRTEPHTDLWQRSYYGFRNDNAPLFVIQSEERFFSFQVQCHFTESKHRFDQGGIVLYQDSENWLKASVEYENEDYAHLGAVVTNLGYSDWSTTRISSKCKSMWYRLSRRDSDFLIENSLDGHSWAQMRLCHLHKIEDSLRFGVYACSPENSSFTAQFTNFHFGECRWQTHDGQAPDPIET